LKNCKNRLALTRPLGFNVCSFIPCTFNCLHGSGDFALRPLTFPLWFLTIMEDWGDSRQDENPGIQVKCTQ